MMPKRRRTHSGQHPLLGLRKGFLFIELLIVMGIMGILMSIVVVAVNPRKHLCDTNNAKRASTAREMTNAINQYQVNTFQRAGGDGIPVGEANAVPICRYGVTGDSTCVNMDVLVPDFLLELPVDTAEANPNYSGFVTYRLAGGLDFASSSHMENCTGS